MQPRSQRSPLSRAAPPNPAKEGQGGVRVHTDPISFAFDCYAVEDRDVPAQGGPIRKDQTVEFNPFHAGRKITGRYRRVEEKKETLVLLTNHHDLSATTIAAIYRERWKIELFFKALKQNLKIKTFVGTSANAVRTQI